MADKKSELDNHIGGLFFMIIFTTVWVILSEYFFDNSDFRIVGITFGIVILYFIFSYLKFLKKNKDLPKQIVENDSKKNRWFYTVFVLEGIAIFVTQVVLLNIGKENLFICFVALIVGLHFIPLAKIFNRKFDYYIGFWTIFISVTGLILIETNQFNFRLTNSLVCVGCALSTAFYGLKQVIEGNHYLETKQT